MEQKVKKRLPGLDVRTLKTALAATLCAVLYFPFNRNPAFACIGAIFGLGRDMPDSRLNGGNRFIGTLIGGFLGMGLFRLYLCFYPDGATRPLMFLLLFIGVGLLIILSLLCRWPGAVQPGGVVLCIILFSTPADTYVAYALNRMLDTGVGVALALGVNKLSFSGRVMRFAAAVRNKIKTGK